MNIRFKSSLLILLYQRFIPRVKPWGILIIACYGLMWHIVIENVEDRFVQERNFVINISVRKCFYPFEIVNCPLDKYGGG